MLARTFQIQSIPAVKAFRDGQVVSEFVGAQPPAAVERFLDSLLPSEADGLVERGDEASLRRAIELEPSRADAAVPLARILHERGDDDEALDLLGRVPGNFAADGLAARIELEQANGDGPADLSAPRSPRSTPATRNGRSTCCSTPCRLPTARSDDIRRVVVGILDELGVEHPLARERAAGSPRRCTSSRDRTGSVSCSSAVAPARLQPGHAHAEQPHRPRRREPAQQIERDRPDPIG